MRRLWLLILLLLAGPALAAEWGQFDNPRFGYAVDVPPGFEPDGAAPANGDGLSFVSTDGTQEFRVWGGNIIAGDFESEVRARMDNAAGDGWSLSYERVTPSWASFSGSRNGMVLYARMIPLCGGTQYATFALRYSKRDIAALEPVIGRLVNSLKATGNGLSC